MKIGVPKQIGNYTISDELGEGSFGKVYKGIDKDDKTQVALKFISKKGKNRRDLEGLRSENQMLKKVSHHNIIRLIDFIETKNEMIIVTDYAGENLGQLLKRHKRFTVEEVKNYSSQIFSALIYLNQNKITHRDLKPANILIKDGIIKICDFGFARKLSASTNFMNSLKGTPLYIAPQILDGRAYTHKVDIWSFGIIIYQLFQGITPFHAETLHQLKPKILGQKVQFPKDMPVDMKTLIGGMLQKNPINRFDWDDLKKQPFFAQNVLTEVNSNSGQSAKKAINSPVKLPQQEILMQQSQNLGVDSVVHFLKGEKDLEQIKKLEKDLLQGKLNARQLKTDSGLYEKIMAILKSYLKDEKIVTKDILLNIYSILTYLITKVKNLTPEQNENNITKRKQLLLCILKLAEQETDSEYLDKEFVLIGFLMKLNFNSVSIDFDTDQDITDLCIREIQNPKSERSFSHALKVMGILANQAIITLAHSEDFFIRVQEEKILSVIAEAYQPAPNKAIVLECLESFIHPNLRAQIDNNNHLRKVFRRLKIDVAIVLLNKKFLSVNPLTIFSQKALQSYAKITYQCLSHSEIFRKQFLKQDFWLQMVKIKNLTSFWLAYDFICSSKEQVPLLTNQILKEYCEGGSCSMDKAFLLARAGLQLAKKLPSPTKTQHLQTLLITISQTLAESEELKIKAARSVQGFLSYGERIFEEAIGQTLCNIFTDKEIKNEVNEGLLLSILQNLFNFKVAGKIRVSAQTTAKIIIVLEQISKLDKVSLRTNKKFLSIIFNIFSFYLNNGVFFQISQEEKPSLNVQFLISIFSLIKNYSIVDDKELYSAYCKAEDKNMQNLLTSDQNLNKKTLNITLSILLKVSVDPKHNQSVIDFVGMNLIPKLKPFVQAIVKELEEGDLEIMLQIIQVLSLIMKKNEQYAAKIRDMEIISHLHFLLQLPNQTLRCQTLMLIGHLAKHSQQFFDQFAKYGVFASIVQSMRKNPNSTASPKIIKGVIYAIGNISFYTDRFQREITALIPLLSETLNNQNDPHTVTNTISTVSNLLRHSNIYLKALVQQNVIRKIMKIVLETKKADNNMMFGLNAIKKVLMYPQIFNDHKLQEFVQIYNEKKSLVGGENQCMKIIRSFM